MVIKVLSLNIERNKHISRVMNLLEKEKADVICLQEIQEPDFEMFKEKFGVQGFFVPMITFPRKENDKERMVRQGIAYYTTLPLLKKEFQFYVGSGTAPKQKFPNDADRVLVLGLVEKEGKEYKLAMTHFTWAGGGGVNEEQQRDVRELVTFLEQHGELVLCGDFNAPRGGEIFEHLNKNFKDNIPPDIQTTLDPNLHKAGPLPYVVDYLWSTPKYSVQKIKIVDGVSDHMAIVAEIEKL